MNDQNHCPLQEQQALGFLVQGGEMGERTRAFDWSKTPLGAMAGWPQSLKTAVSICLGSRYPIVIWWGRDALTQFYNDAYIPVLGVTKHPASLGQSASECWSEIWHIVGPMVEGVFATGEATWSEDLLLVLARNLPHEEAYFTFSYSPIRDDAGAVGGIFCAVTETTSRVVGERRLRTVRDLGRNVMEAKSAAEACQATARTLEANPADIPFALFYLLDGEAQQARLVAATGLQAGSGLAPDRIHLCEQGGGSATWPLRRVYETATAQLVKDLPARLGPLLGGPWPESPDAALVQPIAAPGQPRPTGFLVSGLSPRQVVDADYRNFFDLIAGQVATAVANARAYEAEKRRAEALAEIDRAKTAFFSNVSHEFRTPLTLMLGPVEDILNRSRTELPPAVAAQLEVVNRNGLRLLRLVNNLLDFSRIEAGRVRAVYQPTNLATFTADLASVFRSASERAGLRLVVNCPPLVEPVFVDREMWEKVVFNLLSNAFKFTFEGEIAVTLRQAGTAAELRVSDTGTGIPAEEMPRLFERFHRVEKAQGRTHEGSGIGLALVQELLKLHGGSITAESVVGRGTTFTVAVPLGSAHLPPEHIGTGNTAVPTGGEANPYVEEALRWLPGEGENCPHLPTFQEPLPLPHRPAGSNEEERRPRVLVADDNADMRQYVVRLLTQQYEVEAVPDGEAALAAARQRPPDLILTDVMMPRLDGYSLLREVRASPRTQGVPFIMLSARAGEESRAEGMEAGADDYLVKPFGARELLARVSAHLQMARLRREANESLRRKETFVSGVLGSITDGLFVVDKDWRFSFVNDGIVRRFGKQREEILGGHVWEMFPAAVGNEAYVQLHRAMADRVTVEYEVFFEPWQRWFLEKAFPTDDGGLAVYTQDATERKRQEKELEDSQQTLYSLVERCPFGIYIVDADFRITTMNAGSQNGAFINVRPVIGRPFDEAMRILWPEPVAAEIIQKFRRTLDTGEPYHSKDFVKPRADIDLMEGYEWELHRIMLPNGRHGVVCYYYDSTKLRQVERSLLEAQRQLAAELEAMTRLHALGTRLLAAVDLFAALDDLLENAILTCNADFGTLQLYNPLIEALEIVAHRGFRQDFLDHFRTVRVEEGSACAQAMQSGERIVIEDVQLDPGFTPHRMVAAAADYRAVQSTPLKSSRGSVIGMMSTHFRQPHRPSERDERLLDLYARHAADLIERTQAEKALKEADRRKDEFLATLAHELRNPLAPLRSAVQIIRVKSPDIPELLWARDVIERQAGQMARLLDDLLDVSRITRNRLELRKGRVTLAGVVESAVETSRPLIDAAGHELAVALPSEPVYLDADPVRLAQVFSNLLNNAAKYTDRGGDIRLTAERVGHEVVVTVKDNGIGIAREILPEMFKIFTQAIPALERAQGGLGIGLSLVKGLVEMHGGSVEAHSDGPGKGSEFVVRLPVAVAPKGRGQQPVEVEKPSSAACKIVVADDNRDAADSLAMMLRLLGNEVRTAKDGQEAVEVTEAFRPDVLLLDIGMPRLNGYDACRRIREQQWGKNILIVALTGWGQDEDRRRSDEAGFNSHLVKPVHSAALQRLLAART